MKFNSLRLPGAAVLALAFLTSSAVADTSTTDWEDSTLHVISWAPVSLNEDGTPLTDLAGYYVYEGDSPETLVPALYTLQNATMWWYPVGTTRYFAVTAVNVDGVESQMSAIVSQ